MNTFTVSKLNNLLVTQKAEVFNKLKNVDFISVRDFPIKVYIHGSGANAAVLKCRINNDHYAVRCFLNNNHTVVDHYTRLEEYLKTISVDWKVGFKLLENELKVDGQIYPVLMMDWVKGVPINEFVTSNLHNNFKLSQLQQKIVELSASLEKNRVGHGDIQCGNLFVDTLEGSIALHLIDYDGVYIPGSSNSNFKIGRSEFQHPRLSSRHFNQKMDRFPFWVIITALEAIKSDKSLWSEVMQGGFNTLDNFLFTKDDFSNPSKSQLISRIRSRCDSRAVELVDNLIAFLNVDPDSIPPPTLGKVDPVLPVEPVVKGILIDSEPSNALVLTSTLKIIGRTPIDIDPQKYLSGYVIVTDGNHTIRVSIIDGDQHKVVNFSSEVQKSIPLTTEPRLKTSKQTVVPPSITTNPPQLTARQSPNGPNWLLYIPVIFFLIVVAYIVSDTARKNSESESIIQSNTNTSPRNQQGSQMSSLSLQIYTNHNDTEIRLLDENYNFVTSSKGSLSSRVSPGSFKVHLKKEGFRDEVHNIRVSNQTNNVFRFELTSQLAELLVKTTALDAIVFIGDKQYTPNRIIEIPFGVYDITVRADGYEEKTIKNVRISMQNQSLSVNLVKLTISVRCPANLLDSDFNLYNVIKIGKQCWTASNLKVTRYRNGEMISKWNARMTSKSGSWSQYNDQSIYTDTYGRLYDWYAVNDSRGLCPVGWKVPNNSDWNELINYIQLQNFSSGASLKSKASASQNNVSEYSLLRQPRWLVGESSVGRDIYSFNALASGTRFSTSGFGHLGTRAYFWSSDELSLTTAYRYILSNSSDHLSATPVSKTAGSSVRCVMNN